MREVDNYNPFSEYIQLGKSLKIEDMIISFARRSDVVLTGRYHTNNFSIIFETKKKEE